MPQRHVSFRYVLFVVAFFATAACARISESVRTIASTDAPRPVINNAGQAPNYFSPVSGQTLHSTLGYQLRSSLDTSSTVQRTSTTLGYTVTTSPISF